MYSEAWFLLDIRKKQKRKRPTKASAYAYVELLTNEDGGDMSISRRQSTVSSAILLNVEGSWYRELCQEMVFCACIHPYAYVASVLTCLSLCSCLQYVLVKTNLETCYLNESQAILHFITVNLTSKVVAEGLFRKLLDGAV